MTIGFLVSRLAPDTRVIVRKRNGKDFKVIEESTAAEMAKREGSDKLLSEITEAWEFVEADDGWRTCLQIIL